MIHTTLHVLGVIGEVLGIFVIACIVVALGIAAWVRHGVGK